MSTLSLTVTSYAGAALSDVARDMQALADRIGVVIEMDANGVFWMAFPGGSAEQLEREYRRVVGRDDIKHKSATSVIPWHLRGRTQAGGEA
jgi:hypothetical protein